MKMKKVVGKFGQTENCVYFCTRISAKGSVLSFKKDRDLAQLVAHTSGGREVAGSSPVIPTRGKEEEKHRSFPLFKRIPRFFILLILSLKKRTELFIFVHF